MRNQAAITTAISESAIFGAYTEKTPASAELYRKAMTVFPSGVTHDARYLRPHPLCISRAQSSHKWDVDGNEYVDYFGGHGALILGHNHPAVVEAVQQQVSRGVHYGASHELELEWASLIQKLIPCGERVRFTVSGTEATHLALRVARAYTKKPAILRFASHFHGWHDHVAFSDTGAPAGIVKGIVDNVIICPPGDIDSVKQAFATRDDIAAVILEPTGATFGQVPLDPQFLGDLRTLASEHGIVLIFDEVITGFRCSPGGAQDFYKITPDLAALAKILAGGYPGAALVGKAEIMSVMEFTYNEKGRPVPIVPHQGTYNAEPVSAAAGIATLKIISNINVTETANRTAEQIRNGMNDAIRRKGANWSVYGMFSAFHIFTNPDNEAVGPDDIRAGKVSWQKLKGAVSIELLHKIRAGMLCGGVDVIGWPGGLVSIRHDLNDVDKTVSAFENLLRMLGEERELA